MRPPPRIRKPPLKLRGRGDSISPIQTRPSGSIIQTGVPQTHADPLIADFHRRHQKYDEIRERIFNDDQPSNVTPTDNGQTNEEILDLNNLQTNEETETSPRQGTSRNLDRNLNSPSQENQLHCH